MFFAPHALACCSKVQRDLKVLVTLRTAVLQMPSKSYENRTVRSAFVHFLEIGVMKREARGQGEFSGEFSVGLAARRDVVSQPAT